VVIETRVDPDGGVSAARVIRSSGHRALDASARRAVLRSRFRPARRAGRPVASAVRVPVRFSLR
jgi:protein TonB